MGNSTVESVLGKTFDHLDKIIEEKKQDKSSVDETHTATEDPTEQAAHKAHEIVKEKE